MINNPTFQTCVAIAIVILCSAYLILRVWMKRKTPGCGAADCNCPTNEFKRKPTKKN